MGHATFDLDVLTQPFTKQGEFFFLLRKGFPFWLMLRSNINYYYLKLKNFISKKKQQRKIVKNSDGQWRNGRGTVCHFFYRKNSAFFSWNMQSILLFLTTATPLTEIKDEEYFLLLGKWITFGNFFREKKPRFLALKDRHSLHSRIPCYFLSCERKDPPQLIVCLICIIAKKIHGDSSIWQVFILLFFSWKRTHKPLMEKKQLSITTKQTPYFFCSQQNAHEWLFFLCRKKIFIPNFSYTHWFSCH